ncbi:imidazole glycerol phosphate synthase subunit HisH, partial [bacterium]|nr:imidazole glycerol phosphate synthase subunit HisH [bacterium]
MKSVFNILEFLGYEVKISNSPELIRKASHLILPGVGAFGSAMERIRDRIPLRVLEEEVFENQKPFLGICVGMQVLASSGMEFGFNEGLGWIPGKVVKLDTKNLPSLHIGWNDIKIKRDFPLFSGLSDIKDFYFVHSFVFDEE